MAGDVELFVVYEVMSFTRSKRGGLRPDVPLRIEDPDCALRAAKRLGASKALVLAVARGDSARIMAAFGDVPENVDELSHFG